MAVDSAAKRLNLLDSSLPFGVMLPPDPDGSISEGDRIALLGEYGGNGAGDVTPADVKAVCRAHFRIWDVW